MADDSTSSTPTTPELIPEDPPVPRRKVYQPTLFAGRRRRRVSAWLVIPSLLLLFGGIFYWLFSDTHHVRFVPSAGEIIFASDQGSPGTPHLWITNFDGSGAHRLLPGTAADSDPVFSPHGSQIAFLSNRTGRTNQVFLIGADGKGLIQITRNTGAKTKPFWSRGNPGLLGYLAGGALYEIGSDGNGLNRLLPPPPNTQVAQDTSQSLAQGPTITVPSYAWSPAKNGGLAAVEDTGMFQALAVSPSLNAALKDLQQTSNQPVPLIAADRLSLGWSPDGSLLAVAALNVRGTPNPVSGVFLFEPNGTPVPGAPPMLIGSATVGSQDPVFTPDGTQILVQAWSQPDLASRRRLGLALIPTSGSGGQLPHLIYQGDATDAQFSPDGTEIFFLAARPDGGHDLCRIALDGTGFQRLISGTADITSFSVSPQRPHS